MATSTDLTYNGQTWAKLTLSSVMGQGRISPRLLFNFEARTLREQTRVQVIQLNATVTLNNELLGRGSVREVGEIITWFDGGFLTFDVFTNREAIYFAQEHFRDHTLFFDVEIAGLLHVCDGKDGEPFIPVNVRSPSKMGLPISRSDWIKKVLEPLGIGEYVLMEMPVPRVPDRERWEKALTHLKTAEQQFVQGHDAGVFQSCRAVFEGIEGAPKNNFDNAIVDDEKRKKVDELLKYAVAYFHAGRHVSKSGPQQGEFPVDHRDAEFALSLAKMFLAYIGKLLVKPSP